MLIDTCIYILYIIDIIYAYIYIYIIAASYNKRIDKRLGMPFGVSLRGEFNSFSGDIFCLRCVVLFV